MIKNGWSSKSSSFEVGDHRAHDLDDDDREQHAIDGGRRGGREWLMAGR
jgi:hypothetical protein